MLKTMMNPRSWSWAQGSLFSRFTEIPVQMASIKNGRAGKDSLRLQRRINRKGLLNFQLTREYVPTQKGNGIEFDPSHTSFLALMSDEKFVLYNAFNEQSGTWSLDHTESVLSLKFDEKVNALDIQVYKVNSFEKSQLHLTLHDTLGSVERVFDLLRDDA